MAANRENITSRHTFSKKYYLNQKKSPKTFV